MARILDGKPVAAAITEEVRRKVASLIRSGVTPRLAIVRIGDRDSDIKYERSAARRCEAVGIGTEKFCLPTEADQEAVLRQIREINEDARLHGCLLLRPFPKHMDDAVIRAALRPEKDVDGITDASLSGIFTGEQTGFAPCTADSCMRLLDYYGYGLAGKDVAVVGASLVVGRPLAMMMLKENATVSICHVMTKDITDYCRRADIIVAAAGHAGLITESMLRAGQTVIDVGINVTPEGRIVGDVDFEAASRMAEAVSPVPGGIGSITTSVLALHVAEAAERCSL